MVKVGSGLSREEMLINAADRHVPVSAQLIPEVEVNVCIRGKRKSCATRSVRNVSSEPPSSKALTVNERPEGACTLTVAVDNTTGVGDVVNVTAESAVTFDTLLLASCEFDEAGMLVVCCNEPESTWIIV